jgi:TolB-like protein/class 3 adenylate cyclase/tetratricopeptide (TPR) repeat protein
MTATRRLAAILAADVAGYSRLIGADEEGTLNRLRSIRAELINPQISEHRGRIVKTTGDGLLVEFSSVVDALRCATQWQHEMDERNAAAPDDIRIEFRIGVHQGDIVVEDNDIFGDGVNVAARLEGLAEPGGICVSARVQEDVAGRLDLTFDDIGEQSLKNIARPVRVYRARLASGENAPKKIPTLSRPALPLPDKPSIAVLPFTNMSGDPEQEYFADGMVEEITTAISHLPWLFVIARNSAFTYKGRAVDVRQVASELGVRYVLEGSVRKAGNRVRITGQLIDTTTGAHIWADRFDGGLDDIFDLQDEVASNVVGAIEPKLRQSEIERAIRKPTENLDAYDFYLRGLAEFNKFTEEGMGSAIGLLKRALAIDPQYAPAAALIGLTYQFQRGRGWKPLFGAYAEEAAGLARLALDNGKGDPDVLWMAGLVLSTFAGETVNAANAVDRALALNSNSAYAWMAKGYLLAFGNAGDKGIEAFRRAIRLSPFDPLRFRFTGGLAIAHMMAGQYSEAMEWADNTLHEVQHYTPGIRIKIALCACLGLIDEARQWLDRLLELQPDLTLAEMKVYAAKFLAPEAQELYIDGLRKAGLPEE